MEKKAKIQTHKITLTKQAAKKVLELAKEEGKKDTGLKLFVYPGGCSGFQYGLDFLDKAEDTDVTIVSHGVKLFVDKESLVMLEGTTIDFVDSLQGSGFKIDNPNVTHSCGCGKSFC